MATTAERLTEARDRLHLLLTGSLREEMRFGDRTVVYSPANIAELRRYIEQLEDQVAIETGGRARARNRRVVFTGG